MARSSAYLSRGGRLRRIGAVLLKGVYLWAEAIEGGQAPSPTYPDGAVNAAAIVVEAGKLLESTIRAVPPLVLIGSCAIRR